jgi:hypothetical protein
MPRVTPVDPQDVLPAANPFVHARALTPDEAIRREADVRRLVRLAAGGHNAVLYAPRRFGKTTVLRQVQQAAAELDMPSALVDLSGVLSPADLAARLKRSYEVLPPRLRDHVRSELASVTVPTPFGGFSLARNQTPPDPIAAVHTLLEVPAQLAERTGRRVLAVFDEFQSLVHLDGYDGVLRSHLQHHAAVSYIFCGSEPSLLRALFENRARPLYGQAEQIRLGRLEPQAAERYVEREFERTGKRAGDTPPYLVEAIAERHPQRLMLVAHALWERVEVGGLATLTHLRAAYDGALRQVEHELEYLWEALTANQRRVLAALASGFTPYGREAEVFYGLGRSSAQRPVEALERSAVIERGADGHRHRIVDPLLRRWVVHKAQARLQIFVLPHAGEFIVCDGPSLAFIRSRHATLAEAEAEADALAAKSQAAETVVFDTEDPNDLPAWAIAAPDEEGGR